MFLKLSKILVGFIFECHMFSDFSQKIIFAIRYVFKIQSLEIRSKICVIKVNSRVIHATYSTLQSCVNNNESISS